MNRNIIVLCNILLLFFINNTDLYSQNDITISALRGFLDSNNNVHLLYRQNYENRIDSNNYDWNFSIWHLNLETYSDSIIFYSGGKDNPDFVCSSYIYDVEFFNDLFTEYIYAQFRCADQCSSLTKRYDQTIGINLDQFPPHNIELSKTNPKLLFVSTDKLYKSTNGGKSWNSVVSQRLVSLNPFNNNLFLLDDQNNLYWSGNYGATGSLVDNIKTDYMMNDALDRFFQYDQDNLHVYRVSYNPQQKWYFTVSDNRGRSNSWDLKFSNSSKFCITTDEETQGKLFLSYDNEILVSNSFGQYFDNFQTLKRGPIVGLYCVPGTEILYAATPYSIFQVESNNIKEIKKFIPKDHLNFYPLSVGNKWFYNWSFDGGGSEDYQVEEIVGDTVLSNGKKYFIRRLYANSIYPNRFEYERIDSSTGYLYSFNQSLDTETNLMDLYALENDTLKLDNGVHSICYRFSVGEFDNLEYSVKSYMSPEFYLFDKSYLFGIGVYRFTTGMDFSPTIKLLIGAMIDGVVIGDTNIISTVDQQFRNDLTFTLFQNYPNPFNPTTNIMYRVPNVETEYIPSLHNTKLTVYDILGKEVKTLVNEEQSPGEYKIEFDGTGLSSGIYYYRLQCGDFIEVKKMILIR